MTTRDRLKLVIPDEKSSLLLEDAIVGMPELVMTIDGASTLTMTVADHDRKLASSEAFTTRSWARITDLNANFELVAAGKTGNDVTLTFEDAIAAALRKETGKRRWAAGSATRREILIQLCKAAEVPYRIDPQKRRPVQDLVERGGKDKTSSWDLAGTLATDINWRRFSNGRRLIVGGDDWLLERDEKPTLIRENSGPWGSVDFDLDTGKRAATCTVTVEAETAALVPGDACRIRDDYPATNGRWFVAEYRQSLGSSFATVTLTRKQHTLKEPKGTGGRGDRGDNTFIPDREGDAGASNAGAATNPAREKMVRFALAQAGDRYVWGGNGPSGWDCSGLVQAATAAGGKQLTKPSASQWGTCVAQGRTISIAEALRIRGALLFKIGGTTNHVAISLGNGSTIEAMGSAYGVLVAGNAANRGWTGAALWI